MSRMMGRLGWINLHPADWVNREVGMPLNVA